MEEQRTYKKETCGDTCNEGVSEGGGRKGRGGRKKGSE